MAATKHEIIDPYHPREEPEIFRLYANRVPDSKQAFSAEMTVAEKRATYFHDNPLP
jgi:hypothetical protein